MNTPYFERLLCPWTRSVDAVIGTVSPVIGVSGQFDENQPLPVGPSGTYLPEQTRRGKEHVRRLPRGCSWCGWELLEVVKNPFRFKHKGQQETVSEVAPSPRRIRAEGKFTTIKPVVCKIKRKPENFITSFYDK